MDSSNYHITPFLAKGQAFIKLSGTEGAVAVFGFLKGDFSGIIIRFYDFQNKNKNFRSFAYSYRSDGGG